MAPWAATTAMAQDRSLLETSYYRSTITAVEPPVVGLIVAVTDDGALTVTNRTDKTVIVIGYQGEAYLRITPAGVEENVASVSSSVNGSLVEGLSEAEQQRTGSRMEWRHVSDRPAVTWHDHRTHWMDEKPPPDVAADPRQPRKVFDWMVPLTVDEEPVVVSGTLDWTGRPAAGTWTTALAVFAGTAGLSMAVTIAIARRRGRIAKRVQREPMRVSD